LKINDIVRSRLKTKVSSLYVVDTKERANKIFINYLRLIHMRDVNI